MTPYEIAREMYDGTELEEIMAFCAQNGAVHADDECFFCAYSTSSHLIETTSKLVDEIKSKKGVDKTDTWYIYIASGSLKRAFGHIRPLKYICYERFDGVIRFIEFEKMRRLLWGQK